MVRKIAVVGAGASGKFPTSCLRYRHNADAAKGAAAAAALDAEDFFEEIKVFDRRETAGGTWIYDATPGQLPLTPGALPPQTDPPLSIPDRLPQTTPCCIQYRFEQTPIYELLTTNVPDVAMSFSDIPFAYGPFVRHPIPRQYTESYFSWHRTDSHLQLHTTVEDISVIPDHRWRLVLRRHDAARQVDDWWDEEFDAVVLANGHYSVPFVPHAEGIEKFRAEFPNRIEHSKTYRSPRQYSNQRVIVVGNSASGYDIAHQLVESNLVERPLIVFADGTVLQGIDKVIYCTGYQPSYPLWNVRRNGGPLYSYSSGRLIRNYQHTFFRDFPTLAIIGLPRVLTFRSFEYQAIAISRLWSGRTRLPLPSLKEQEKWEEHRAALANAQHRKFHQIDWDDGETMDWFRWLFEFAGLPTLEGQGKSPPVLGPKTRWAIEHIKKYPTDETSVKGQDAEWEGVSGSKQGSLWFV